MSATMTAPPASPGLVPQAPVDPSAFEIVHLASLLASRLCHDLVNPVGALSTGLDVLDEDPDADMQAHALRLVRESADKTIAMLTFARIAFGASGSWDGEIDLGEARDVTEKLYHHVKADLRWELTARALPKPRARALLNVLLLAEKSVPRNGSTVRVFAEGERLVVHATGPKVKLSDVTAAALSGDAADLAAKETPAYLAALLCRASGDTLTATKPDEEIVVFEIDPAR